jgi:putative salt-induced outer membrane protein YdiY
MSASITTKQYLLCLPLLLLPVPALAIVDMENVHLGKKQEGISGSFELSAYTTSGNTEKEEVSLGARLEWNRELHTLFGVVNYSYGENQDEVNIDKGFVHLRHVYQFHDVVASEIFAQSSQDKFRRLNYRGILGAGIRYNLFEQQDTSAVFLGAGAFYEKESLTRDDNDTEDVVTETGRANFYLVMKFRISDSTSFVSSTYYQPDLRYSVDYRVSENAGLIININKELAVKLGISATHDSQPPQDVEPTDATYTTSILYQF